MPNYIKFQVKSSGQWLNILNGGNVPGTIACQGVKADSENFFWEIINSSVPEWSLIMVKSSGLYLNINGGGNAACQNPLPNPTGTPPDNFLWQIEAPDSNGWSMIKVKSSGKYLYVLNNGTGNGDPLGVSDHSTAPNFLWMQYNAIPTPVTVTMNILNCSSIYNLPPNGTDRTTLNDEQADQWLSMEDNNKGKKENSKQSSFESILNPGSQVTWEAQKGSGNDNSGYTVAITNITYEDGSGSNILGLLPRNGNSDKVQAQVIWTAIRPDSGGDNEAYTIEFTLKKGNDQPKKYTFDPKIRVDPTR